MSSLDYNERPSQGFLESNEKPASSHVISKDSIEIKKEENA
jgi:hypothetical protein